MHDVTVTLWATPDAWKDEPDDTIVDSLDNFNSPSFPSHFVHHDSTHMYLSLRELIMLPRHTPWCLFSPLSIAIPTLEATHGN